MSRRVWQSNQQPMKWSVTVWDTVTDTDKIVSKPLPEDKAFRLMDTLENRHQKRFVYGLQGTPPYRNWSG
jgi:hypothetical protein